MSGSFPTFELNDEFFEGISDNPIHQAMFLPLPSIKLAQLSSSAKNMELAKLGMLEQIDFTADEQKTYAYLQIAANNYLQAKGLVTLPLLHLTPRMLLPFLNPQSSPDTVRFDDINYLPINEKLIENDIDAISLKQKKKKKKKKKKSENDGSITSIFKDNLPNSTTPENVLDVGTKLSNHNEEEHEIYKPRLEGSPKTSWSIPEVSIALESFSADQALIVKNLCCSYENELVNLRERYEGVVQSLNLRLYVAQAEVDRLKFLNGNPARGSKILELVGREKSDTKNV